MDDREYQEAIFPKLRNSFGKCNWALGSGTELIARGWDPNGLLVTAESIENLSSLTQEQNLEIYIPIFGYGGESALFAKDAEIFLADPYYLYYNVGSQLHFFNNHLFPVISYESKLLKKHGVPHMIDLTPSGWHILFRVRRGTEAFNRLASIGCLEDELADKYDFTDPHDIKRNPAPGVDAGLVFSGMGRLKEYIAFKSLVHAEKYEEIPITISDSEEKCVNEDITDCGDPGYMRIMRAPFSLHKKRRTYIQGSAKSLQDIIMGVYFGKGKKDIFIEDMDYLLNCMWNKEMAVQHAENFSGEIPEADDDSINSLVDEYEASDLYRYHKDFDEMPRLANWQAFIRAQRDPKLSDKTKNFIEYPCPRALQPKVLIKFAENLMENGWQPKEIGCLIDDFYHLQYDKTTQEKLDWGALDDYHKYCKITRAYFWARVYCALFLIHKKEINL